jgi:hypothetical protein
MLEKVKVNSGSFPLFEFNKNLVIEDNKLWQVIAGDYGKWRAGIYSPELTSGREVRKLEKNTHALSFSF